MRDYDVFVIGGGINGCGIARDAAGRGYRVGLAEMNDLASGTSSWSTKLIHGGLRYLEHYEFSLVRHALGERERLWAIAPHIIRPLRFVLPHHAGLRPAWLLRLGLFLYDHIGGRRTLKKTTAVSLADGPLGAPLKPVFKKGFEYSDARVDDARLVILNARDAEARGADIMVRTKVVAAQRIDDAWTITLQDMATGARSEVRARYLVNVAGPWVDQVVHDVMNRRERRHVRLVQGSHIVTRKLYEHDRAYIFQNADGRIIFAIPYEDDYTLIGTTDRDYDGDPGGAVITEEEISYLLAAASEYFAEPVTRDEVVWSYSGVRPLYDDGASKAQEATRDYVLTVEAGELGHAPVLNCFGGKITTYRVLSEEVVEKIAEHLGGRGSSWTAGAALPGGDFAVDGVGALEASLGQAVPALDARTIRRLVRSYGTLASGIMTGGALGRDFGHGLFECEVKWLIAKEWARTSEDVLWRRTKLGLRFAPQEAKELDDYMRQVTASRLAAE
ncbi:glycerol-3-phosphate dehydrogenase [Mangrovicella endophytica]|uniref:glycerol-3-phosphate dehydrogenase n=1 Tax=Mangrovicella endophytica TaxID=2066697 RepID=UPI000C9E820D|nr:glycerol-3-phosphate dehydrogenase [Mangrovicella endophytica]